MRVLVVGSGGREHALAWKLRRSPSVAELIIAPGNGGTAGLGENVAIATEDIPALVDLAHSRDVDLTVVGPEAPLAAGIADAFIEAGLAVSGPTREAAALESSKSFAKQFMTRHAIPTADYQVFTDYREARAYVDALEAPPVVKADGLAAGKGVIVCDTFEEAQRALERVMVEREFGSAGDIVVIEERLHGQEVSLLAFCDGKTLVPMVSAQDHKRAYDGDTGPNTGGMGAYAPAPALNRALAEQVIEQVLEATVDGMREEGRPYRGVLYAGLILTEDGPQVLEYNCRFGDPEAQVLMPLMDCDLAEVLLQCAQGRLQPRAVRWHAGAAVCVVMASGGYPNGYRTGYPIEGIAEAEAAGCIVFHAGTRLRDGRLVTAGGRVLGVTGAGDSLEAAIERAYDGVHRIRFEDAHYRSDIGAKGLAGAGMPGLAAAIPPQGD